MKAIILSLLLCLVISYDTEAAVNYAKEHCNNYNPKYSNFGLGSESANFVSQCLLAGGFDFLGCPGVNDKGVIVSIPALRNCLISKGWRRTQGMSKQFKAGFPIFKGNSYVMIASSVEQKEAKICGHAPDTCDQSLPASDSYLYFFK